MMIKALKTEQADEVKKKDYCIEELSKNKPLRLAPILRMGFFCFSLCVFFFLDGPWHFVSPEVFSL